MGEIARFPRPADDPGALGPQGGPAPNTPPNTPPGAPIAMTTATPTVATGRQAPGVQDAASGSEDDWEEQATMEERLMRRCCSGGPDWLLRVRIGSKRLAWAAVVSSTYLFKRALDLLVAGPLLLLLLPLLALVALAIRLESPGPVLFRQTRVGRFGQLFQMLKFRSMYQDAEARKAALLAANESTGGVIFKMRRDPRITRVGRLIRKTSIDELPQLWNVLKGDMSLVGPRPALPSEVDAYSLADRRRLEVIPGITGLWQVSGRSEIPFPQQVELDVRYIESQSLLTDVRLLFLTVPAVLLGRGAY